MSYARYQPMIDDARPHTALWRLFVGSAFVLAIATIWVFGILFIASLKNRLSFSETLDLIPYLGRDASGTVLFLFLYAGIGYGTFVVARALHKRIPRSLIGPPARTLRHFVVAALATWGVMAIFALITFSITAPPMPNLDFGIWLKWLPLGLLVVAAQTGSEEVFFRGYLQSQLAGRFKMTWVWLVLPALAFGLLHATPALPAELALAYAGVAAFFGLLAGDLTARTGSIGAAWGFHFANNCLVILFIAADPNISGLGLYRSGMDLTDMLSLSPLLVVDILALGVIWVLIRKLLSA